MRQEQKWRRWGQKALRERGEDLRPPPRDPYEEPRARGRRSEGVWCREGASRKHPRAQYENIIGGKPVGTQQCAELSSRGCAAATTDSLGLAAQCHVRMSGFPGGPLVPRIRVVEKHSCRGWLKGPRLPPWRRICGIFGGSARSRRIAKYVDETDTRGFFPGNCSLNSAMDSPGNARIIGAPRVCADLESKRWKSRGCERGRKHSTDCLNCKLDCFGSFRFSCGTRGDGTGI